MLTCMAETIRPTDETAKALARSLVSETRYAALGVQHPDTAVPFVSRVAIALISNRLTTLVSDLATHSLALKSVPDAGLMLSEPGLKGDPMTHPRLSLAVRATFCDDKSHVQEWLSFHPKSKLYVDFADFRFVEFEVLTGSLNAGFGRAYNLLPQDIGL